MKCGSAYFLFHYSEEISVYILTLYLSFVYYKKMTNCTIKFMENNIAYNIFQNTTNCLLAIYVIGINVSAIVLTMVGRNLWKCPVNKMMMSGHVSNIPATISFTMNNLYYSHNMVLLNLDANTA